MNTVKIPYSGQLLVAHLAAYGLAAIIDDRGGDAYVGHDPQALELTPLVLTNAGGDLVAEWIRSSAAACRDAVYADVVPGQTGNKQIPVIRARQTKLEGAAEAFPKREAILDALEADGNLLAAGLLAGLGAPAPWLQDRFGKPVPQRGASQLDGVPYNIGSDVVRGFLRRCIEAGINANPEDLGADTALASREEDRSRWTPAHTRLAPLFQWLAALGLTLLPVGLTAANRSRTPAFRRETGTREIVLPVLTQPVSVPRLRAILARRDLPEATTDIACAGRLRALGIAELATFSVIEASNSTMVSFSFAAATVRPL